MKKIRYTKYINFYCNQDESHEELGARVNKYIEEYYEAQPLSLDVKQTDEISLLISGGFKINQTFEKNTTNNKEIWRVYSHDGVLLREW